MPTKKVTRSPAVKPPRVSKKLAHAFERLGIILDRSPAIDPASLQLQGAYLDRCGWMAHAVYPAGAYRTAEVRGFRFSSPWCYPAHRPTAFAPPRVVIGQTSESLFHLSSVEHFETTTAPGLPRWAPRTRELATFLGQLEPDEDYATRAVPSTERASLSPMMDAHVRWSLARAGIADLASASIPRHEVQRLDTLGLASLDSLEELDARFQDLTTLHIRQAKLADLSPLLRLPRLRRLMLFGCVIADPSPLAALTHLEELHLPGCLLTTEALAFLERMPSLRSVSLAGNLIADAKREWLDALPLELQPRGTSPRELRVAGLFAQQGTRAGVVLDERFLAKPESEQDAFGIASIAAWGRVIWHWAQVPGEAAKPPSLPALTGTADPDYLTAFTRWPGNATPPSVARFAADGLESALRALGGSPGAPVSTWATATQNLLAATSWPDRAYTYRAARRPSRSRWAEAFASAGAMQDPQLLRDCRFVSLHAMDLGERHEPALLLGTAEDETRLLVMRSDATPDPTIAVYDAARPDRPLSTCSLMQLLGGLTLDTVAAPRRASAMLHDGTPWPLSVSDQVKRLNGKPPATATERRVETIAGKMALSPLVSAFASIDWGKRGFATKEQRAEIRLTTTEITERVTEDHVGPLFSIAYDERQFWCCVRVDDGSLDPLVYRVDCDGIGALGRGTPLSLFLASLRIFRG